MDASVAQEPSAKPYRVEVFVDRRYDDSDSSLIRIQRLFRRLPPTYVQVQPDENDLSALIARVYGFGVSQLPKTYSLVATETRRINNLPGDSIPAGGSILVPSIARWSPPVGYDPQNLSLGYRRDLASNRAVLPTEGELITRPNVTTSVATDIVGGGTIALSVRWLTPQVSKKGVFTASLRFETSDSAQLNALGDEEALILDGPLEAMDSESMVEALTDDDKRFELQPAEREAIVGAVGRHVAGVPFVVLDFEWPDRVRAEESISWLYMVLNLVRKSKNLQQLRTFQLPQDFGTTATPHSNAIANALTQFRDLDTKGSVLIRYVPLARSGGADSVLVDLVSTYFLGRRRESMPAAVPNPAAARADAVTAVSGIPQEPEKEAGILKSSRVLLDALLYVLDRQSRVTGVPYVLNLSWVLRSPLSVMPRVTEPPRGLIVAATGNYKEDVVQQTRDLSRWSASARYVLSVENYNSNQRRTCDTNFLPPASEAVELSRAVAYRGGRVPSGKYKCGTSFSAPRVGWVVALGLSTLPAVENWSAWNETLWHAIRRASAAGPGDPTHTFDVPAFLNYVKTIGQR